VTALPLALSRWREQLRIFPDDLASVLGRLIVRLAPAVDSLSRSEHDAAGDIDGFDGIETRGSYERLLASEWMLSRAVPLEFLRRAAAGEQAFLRLARRTPAQPERTLVLFDAGPDQLGGCRIVQLALLVLLVERCSSEGRELRWQLLHHQGETLRSRLDAISVRAFLQGRTGLRASAATVTSWLEAHAGAHVWLVGSHATTEFGKTAFARLRLEEQVTLEAPAVDVLLEAGTERRVTLLLPESDQCTRLLRDPFEQAKPRGSMAPRIDGGVLLNATGRRLFYCTHGGGLIGVPVPNSPRATPGKLRLYTPSGRGHEICCVAGRSKRVVWLSHKDGLLNVGNTASSPPQMPLVASGPEPAKPSPLAWFGEEIAYYTTNERALCRADFRRGRSGLIAEGVRAWLQPDHRAVVAVDHFVETGKGPAPCLLQLIPYKATLILRRDTAWQEVHLSSSGDGCFTLAFSENEAFRIESWLDTPHGWHVDSSSTLHRPNGTTVLGVEAHTRHQPAPGLWLLEGSRREITIVRRSSTRAILKTDATIEHTHLAANASALAVCTSAGEILVVSTAGKLLYRGNTAP